MAKAEKEIKETALAVVEFTPAVMDEEFGAIMKEEMDGLSAKFARIKIPSGGGLTFEVPGDDPDNPEVVKEFKGVVVDHHPCNALWLEAYASGGDSPPDCSSLDGKVGYTKEGEKRVCATCSYNQWGSDPVGSGGKWCKNMRRMYMLQESAIFPMLLTVPPTSLKNVADYVLRVLSRKLRLCDVITTASLRKATNSTGITYSQVFFKLAGVLSPETRKYMQQYSADIKPITRQLAIGVEDYYVAETEDTDGIEVSEEAPSAPRYKPANEAPFDIPGHVKKSAATNTGKEDDPYFGSNPPF